jgi:hypothetical protein
MMAVFECAHCKSRTIRGYYKGGDMYQAELPCLPCKAVTDHKFDEYEFIDERSDVVRAQEAREKANGR